MYDNENKKGCQTAPLSSKPPYLWLREGFREEGNNLCSVAGTWLAFVFHLASIVFNIIFWPGCQISNLGHFTYKSRFYIALGNLKDFWQHWIIYLWQWSCPLGWSSLWIPRVPCSLPGVTCDFCSCLSPTLCWEGCNHCLQLVQRVTS